MKSALILVVAVSLSFAQKGSVTKRLSDKDILTKMEARGAGIQDYTAILDVAVDLERLKVPSMHVTMYFKEPDRVHFSSEGFALLPKESISLGPAQLRSRFDIVRASDTTEKKMKLSLLELKPRGDRTNVRRVYATVDQELWLLRRVTSFQPDGRSIVAEFQYAQVQGFWLPSELVVQFISTPSDTSSTDTFEPLGPLRRAQIPREGRISIRYSDYRINTGLNDSVFAKPDKGK